MFQEFLSGSRYLLLPLLAMGFFFVVFVSLLLWVVLGKRGGDFDRVARLPLDDDSLSGGASTMRVEEERDR